MMAASLPGWRRIRQLHRTSPVLNVATMLFSLALTAMVVWGMQRVERQNFAPYLHANIAIRRFISGAITDLGFPAAQPSPPAPAQPIFDRELAMSPAELLNRWNPLIAEASHRFGVSQSWIKAVMRVESGGRTVVAGDQPITSSAGAVGVMQVMRGTYDEMRKQYRLGADPFDPHDNVFAGAAYLRWLHRKYGFPDMFAAYNDGPGKLEDHLHHGRALPQETVNYLANVTRILGRTNERFHRGRITELAELTPARHRFSATIHG